MILSYLAAVLASVLWGSSFLLTKITLTEMGPLSVAGLRWWIASILMVAFLAAHPAGRKRMALALRQHWLLFIFLGVVGEAIFYILQNIALVYTTSIDVGLIMNIFPVLTAMMGVWILGEEFNWQGVAGTALALAGVTLITLGSTSNGVEVASARLLGNMLAIIAVFAGSAYLVAGKRLVTEYGPLTVSALAGAFGAIALTPTAVWEGINFQVSGQVWAALMGLALGCSVAAYLLWWYAAARMPLSRAGVFIYVSPIVSTALGVIILGEPMGLATSAGALLVLGGMVLVQT
jgi:drug/metabolite transporter (DMT)-like permease